MNGDSTPFKKYGLKNNLSQAVSGNSISPVSTPASLNSDCNNSNLKMKICPADRLFNQESEMDFEVYSKDKGKENDSQSGSLDEKNKAENLASAEES